MKQAKMLLLVILLLGMASCGDYTQIVCVAPTSEGITKVSGDFYQYENSDIIIKYSFWGERGLMGFWIYNKTDHPIYIDWKKSNMISGEKQMKYYTNKVTNNYTSYGNSYGTSWIGIFHNYGFSNSSNFTVGQETIVREERVTFISPKSYITNAFYNLVSNIYFDINNRSTKEVRIDEEKVYVSKTDYDINFRNYITYSDKENFETEKHADNGFRVSKVYTVPDNHEYLQNQWQEPYRFYIKNIEEDDLAQKPPSGPRL